MSKKILNFLLVVIWMTLIFIMSSFNSTESSNQSNFIINIITNLFNINNLELLTLITRKTAHFTEYLILGMLVSNMIYYYDKKAYIDIIICIIYAISDEIHQLFVPGRSYQTLDIIIDSIGSLVGIYLLILIKKRKKYNKQNIINKEENIEKITNKVSDTIYCIKAFAILSVIAAHVNTLVDKNLMEKCITSIWMIIGQIGVICFFILGGFLYTRNSNDNKYFWKKKFKKLIIPWIICSTITYFVNLILCNKSINLFEYIKWICGSGTWYYYITVFLICLFIFKYLYKSNRLLILIIIINIISIFFKTIGIQTNIEWSFMTDYLNPLNWIGFFSFGIIMRKYRIDKKICNNQIIFIISILLMLTTTYIMIEKQIFTYFHILSVINSVASFFVIYKISYYLTDYKIINYLKQIGCSTYCIYLLHMHIVQYIAIFLPKSIIMYILLPIFSLLTMMIIIQIGKYICNKIPYGKFIKNIVGL